MSKKPTKYSKNRHLIKEGDMVVWYSDNFVARLIQSVANKGSHTGIITTYGDRVMVTDSFWYGGTRLVPASDILNATDTWCIRRPKKKISIDEIKRMTGSFLGRTYDFYSVIVRLPMYIWFGKYQKKNNYEEAEAMFCSEYTAKIYGMDEWWKTTPNDLLVSDEFNTIIR